jgi:ankyrin repeat protein
LKAAARGDLAGVRRLVGRNKAWVRQLGPHGRTMLWEAAYAGRLAVVEYLAERGADLGQPGCYYTPMLAEVSPRTAAMLKKHKSVVLALKRRGAKVDFHDACYLGDESFVQRAIKKDRSIVGKRKPKSSDPAAATPIFYAVAGAQRGIVGALLEVGPTTQARDGLLLRWAVWQGNFEIIEQLLVCGASPNDSGLNDWALNPELKRLAARHGHFVDLNAPNWLGFPALVDACRGNHNQPDDAARVRPLLEAGVDVTVKDAKGKTALHRAAQAGFIEIAKLLLQSGADIDALDPEGETPVFDAVRAGRAETVRLLLRAGADVRVKNRRRKTAADLAARLGGAKGEQIVDLLS